ncbi:hypothetical protein ALQ37_200204 [Pseudomonas syringae pv. aptata]|uniref:Uncharacterized protein n=1 Tax=Pseudomonas syringae pv. aptata TaxID=83167 RepID=A0A3M3X5T1_PSEAP|nr:hypothetical protein ALQ37_200204 [Pseudomonas syringae pv. aptata]
MNILNLKGLTNERNLYPVIANITLFFFMMIQMPLSVYSIVESILIIFIANKIYQLINLWELDVKNLRRIFLFSALSLICISQFYQHAFNFSFLDWLVTFCEFSKQAPMSIFGIFSYVALPIGAGIAINAHINKMKKIG